MARGKLAGGIWAGGISGWGRCRTPSKGAPKITEKTGVSHHSRVVGSVPIDSSCRGVISKPPNLFYVDLCIQHIHVVFVSLKWKVAHGGGGVVMLIVFHKY